MGRSERNSEPVSLEHLAVRGEQTRIHVYSCYRCGFQEAFADQSDAKLWHRVSGLVRESGGGAYFCSPCFVDIRGGALDATRKQAS